MIDGVEKLNTNILTETKNHEPFPLEVRLLLQNKSRVKVDMYIPTAKIVLVPI